MAVNVSVQNIKRGDGGAFVTGARTGVVGATLAAGSATAGHVWACRFVASAGGATVNRARRALIQRFRAKFTTVAGFTAAQEVAFDLFKVTACTALPADGTALTPSKKATAFTSPLMTGKIATTAALTVGTYTFDTDPIRGCSWPELATGATIPKGPGGDIFMSTEDLAEFPLILAPDEGLVLRNVVAFGGGGTVRITVEMDWLEVERY